MTELNCILIPADDTRPLQQVTVANDYRKMAAKIGGQYIERVRCHRTPAHSVVLLVDEEFLLYHDEQTPNLRASRLYGGIIQGDALLIAEGPAGPPDFGLDFVSMNDDTATMIMAELEEDA